MQLAPSTISILNNFASINPSIVFRPGSKIETISEIGTLIGFAEVEEKFPKVVGIGDLKKFLSVVSLFNQPDLEFEDKYVQISSGTKKVKYVYADLSTIRQVKGAPTLPSTDVSFVLEKEVLDSAKKAMSILGVEFLMIEGRDGKLIVSATETKQRNPTSDCYEVEIGETSHTFQFFFEKETLNLIPATYDVTISKKMIASFKSDRLHYWIGLDTASTFTN